MTSYTSPDCLSTTMLPLGGILRANTLEGGGLGLVSVKGPVGIEVVTLVYHTVHAPQMAPPTLQLARAAQACSLSASSSLSGWFVDSFNPIIVRFKRIWVSMVP